MPLTSRHCFKMVLFVLFISTLNASGTGLYHAQSQKESLLPIRPGEPGKAPFWNQYAKRFIHAPAFDFSELDGAATYRFIASSSAGFRDFTFTADEPWSDLTPIWGELPVGPVLLRVHGLDAQNNVLGLVGAREFYRAAVFDGPYHAPAADYAESAETAIRYLYNMEHVQHWLTHNTPFPDYDLYCYPSKVIGSVIKGMVLFAGLSPGDSVNAIVIAKNAADFLINTSEPASSTMPFFPQTYRGDALSAKEYPGQIMVQYATDAAMAYLDLFSITQDSLYFQQALRIAETYRSLQRTEGTWFLKLYTATGEPVTQNLSLPLEIISYLDRLIKEYGKIEYEECAAKAVAYLMLNPAKTFNWEGQFEDVPPTEPYQNLTKHQACSLAIYLLSQETQTDADIKLALELIRFAEDIFVIWEKPFASALSHQNSHSDYWMTPVVLEQYRCYLPVDASASKLILSFVAAYEATGKELYIAKAVALANNMTRIQKHFGGRYTTWWQTNNQGWTYDWINCAIFDAEVMMSFHDKIRKLDNRYALWQDKPLALLLALPVTPQVVTELSRRFNSMDDPLVKSDLLRALVQRDKQIALPLLQQAVAAKNKNLRTTALFLAGEVADAVLESSVEKAAVETDAELKAAALHAQLAIAERCRQSNPEKAKELLLSVLENNADFFDMKKAFSALSTFPDFSPQHASIDILRQKTKGLANKNGFITDWWVAGPFSNKEDQGERAVYFPEKKVCFDDEKTIDQVPVKWQQVLTSNIYGQLVIADLFGRNQLVAYAYADLECVKENDALFKIGSNDGVVCWLNGDKVHENFTGRVLTVDEDVVSVNLMRGTNKILLKIPNRGGAWECCLRVCDKSGLPLDLSK
jgi:hypothetical protein